jgi:hypothetical protein
MRRLVFGVTAGQFLLLRDLFSKLQAWPSPHSLP